MHSLHPKLFLPAAHAIGAFVGLCLLLLYYALVYSPLVAQEGSDSRRTTELKQGLQDSLEVRREHLQLTNQLEELNQVVADAHTRLPPMSTESRFLSRATSAAAAKRVRLQDYRRDGITVGDRYGEVSVVLRGAGSHAAICRFLENLNEFPYAAILNELHISSANSPNGYSFTAKYLLYHDAAADTLKTASNLPPASAPPIE